MLLKNPTKNYQNLKKKIFQKFKQGIQKIYRRRKHDPNFLRNAFKKLSQEYLRAESI